MAEREKTNFLHARQVYCSSLERMRDLIVLDGIGAHLLVGDALADGEFDARLRRKSRFKMARLYFELARTIPEGCLLHSKFVEQSQ